jgi:hypothetical protein
MSNDININFALFAEATRRKLRFPIGGSISVEDVWDLPLKPRGNRPEPSLNELAQILTDLVEKLLEIVLAVIRVKKAEAKAKEGAVAQASQLSELDALIARKRQDALANLSLEELEKRRSEIAAKV